MIGSLLTVRGERVPSQSVEPGPRGLIGGLDLETFAEMRVAPSKLYDLGDVVVVLGEFRAKGATSGAAFAAPMGWRFEVRDRKVVRGRDYLDHGSALEAAGLSE